MIGSQCATARGPLSLPLLPGAEDESAPLSQTCRVHGVTHMSDGAQGAFSPSLLGDLSRQAVHGIVVLRTP